MKKYLLAVAAGLLPLVTFAAQNTVTVNTNGINNAITSLTHTINLIVPLLLAVAIVFFVYGVIRYIIANGAEDAAKARGFIIWSVVGLAAVLAVWGLARLLINFFGLSPEQLTPDYIPTVPTSGTAPEY